MLIMGESVGEREMRPPCRARLVRSTVRIACDIVVPAKAGTHTPRPMLGAREQPPFFFIDIGGYGSLLSQGRRGKFPALSGKSTNRFKLIPTSH
jgi:hypothetical protein